MSDMPLLDALLRYAAGDPVRMHMPGHKGAPVFPDVPLTEALDVTELPDTDSLYEASGPIRRAEERAQALYGSRLTAFSAGGSTLCIQAMLRLTLPEGAQVLLSRGAHRSAVQTMALLDARPVWLYPQREADGCRRISAAAVQAALAAHPAVRAVLLTSPDYYGVLSDVAGIARVCRAAGVPLLVDNAHGAHLIAFPGLHPLAQGASMCCDSAHKTLASLTGGAFLHLGAGDISLAQVRAAMVLFGSSSPSFLILASLDAARSRLEADGGAAYRALANRLDEIAASLPAPLRRVPGDPCRLTLDARAWPGGGVAVDAALAAQGIVAEYHDERYVVLLPSPSTPPAHLERLDAALRDLAPDPTAALPAPEETASFPVAQTALTPREALFAPRALLPTAQAAGRVAAQTVSLCPPGWPLVLPGERISQAHLALLCRAGIDKLAVVQ